MNLVPRRDLMDRLVPAQCFQRYLRLELPREPPSCGHCVSLPQSVEYTSANCPIFWDHLTTTNSKKEDDRSTILYNSLSSEIAIESFVSGSRVVYHVPRAPISM